MHQQNRRGRPQRNKRIKFLHNENFYKPQGVAMRDLEIIELSIEEMEALRLKNIEDFDQNTCAEKMNTSQSTFQRILTSAYKKISTALINGHAIKISKE